MFFFKKRRKKILTTIIDNYHRTRCHPSLQKHIALPYFSTTKKSTTQWITIKKQCYEKDNCNGNCAADYRRYWF
ncbi:MAG: hypothetical protein ACQUYJ_08975 [Ferruginibacter sp.]